MKNVLFRADLETWMLAKYSWDLVTESRISSVLGSAAMCPAAPAVVRELMGRDADADGLGEVVMAVSFGLKVVMP